MSLSTQAKHQNILRKEIAWMQRGARARSTKQKAHIQRYEALRDEEKIEIDGQVEIEAVTSRLGNKTVEIKNISKSFGDKLLINDFTYTFLRDDRIGILGPNGCGKSTLIKMIVDEIEPDKGHIETGETVIIGYYAQESEGMNPEEKVIDYIKDVAEYISMPGGVYISASQMLERFLFNSTMQYSKIGKLSGGEKRRLYLAKVLMGAPNVLILDEPTNDLDITTLQILEDYLDSFSGIIIAVSHDRYFLDRIARRMLTFEPGGKIELYNGSYTEYFKSHSISEEQLSVKEKSSGGADAYKLMKEQTKKLKFTYNEQKEYEHIEDDIAALEDKIAELNDKLIDPKISSNFVELNKITKEVEETEKELEEKMERFIYLSELDEKIRNESNRS